MPKYDSFTKIAMNSFLANGEIAAFLKGSEGASNERGEEGDRENEGKSNKSEEEGDIKEDFFDAEEEIKKEETVKEKTVKEGDERKDNTTSPIQGQVEDTSPAELLHTKIDDWNARVMKITSTIMKFYLHVPNINGKHVPEKSKDLKEYIGTLTEDIQDGEFQTTMTKKFNEKFPTGGP